MPQSDMRSLVDFIIQSHLPQVYYLGKDNIDRTEKIQILEILAV